MEIERHSRFSDFVSLNHLSVSQDGYVVTDEKWRQSPLPSPFSRLYYVMEGAGMLISEEEQMPLEPGFVYLAPCGASCGFYGTDSVTKLFFHINIILPDGYDLFAASRHFAKRERSRQQMEQLLSWYRSEDAAKQILLMGELWRTVADFAADAYWQEGRSISHSQTVESAILYIRDHLSAGLTVSEVASAVFCSAAHLSTVFSKEMGTTVARYIEDLLMFEARRLLLSSTRSVGDISASLGFCDQFYFSRRFRTRFLISPREYRKQRGRT